LDDTWICEINLLIEGEIFKFDSKFDLSIYLFIYEGVFKHFEVFSILHIETKSFFLRCLLWLLLVF